MAFRPVGRISRRRNPPPLLARAFGGLRLRLTRPTIVLVDDIVAKRIDAGDIRLTAVEWKSGANMRIVDVVAPFGGEAEMRGQIVEL
ncbi:toxin-activating lysine-acyltransferase [Bradyrhizobium lablabi]|uniref:toxin-activating lysine-acyltransferase n=1 Tax=Bradyrhizobium lablabi TaxID=722472 RepID=UPI002012F6BE|nr:toxin-activating lysine-acyltransferase [Bradyrhizobium lablabi]